MAAHRFLTAPPRLERPPLAAMPMTVYIAGPSGSQTAVEVQEDTTVGQLAEAAGAGARHGLTFQGAPLRDPAALLADVGVTAEAVLHVAGDPVPELEKKLGELPSPGCRMQKYLRWLEGTPASDPRIARSLWLLSVMGGSCSGDRLPPYRAASQRGTEVDWSDLIPVEEVAAACLMGLDVLWNAGRYEEEEEEEEEGEEATRPAPAKPIPALERGRRVTLETADLLGATRDRARRLPSVQAFVAALQPHYDVGRHCKLLEWITENADASLATRERANRGLRVTMAEIDQVLCRGTPDFVRPLGDGDFPHPRQLDSYNHLLRIATVTPGVEFWA